MSQNKHFESRAEAALMWVIFALVVAYGTALFVPVRTPPKPVTDLLEGGMWVLAAVLGGTQTVRAIGRAKHQRAPKEPSNGSHKTQYKKYVRGVSRDANGRFCRSSEQCAFEPVDDTVQDIDPP
jgi:hypothetical protein